MTTFQEFVEKRRLLWEFCRLQYPSIQHFHAGLSYAIRREEIENKEIKSDEVRHLTSTVTCLECLLGSPERFMPAGISQVRQIKAEAVRYANAAILKPPDEWKSDKSASIYCRCRTLPLVTQYLAEWHDSIRDHLEAILKQLTDPKRFAIGEADPQQTQVVQYPPNAYHTFWTLETLTSLTSRRDGNFPSKYKDLATSLGLEAQAEKLERWARETLAYQVSLHSAESSLLDSDQLAWALAIVIRAPEKYRANVREQDFVRQAFKCLFTTQTPVGSWQHYSPLFHYLATGNAYCYVFETFAVLLGQALKPGAEFIRMILRSHSEKLLKLWQYAVSTQVLIDAVDKCIVWSSGHRVYNSDPESWATASVFSYAHALRRLVGIWAREDALSSLPKRNYYSKRDEARNLLVQRTQTWTSEPNLAEQLATMFVNQAALREKEDLLEPDSPPIGEKHARSAILYGPPGASKTFTIRALAGAVGWDYIELHASHFVADGLPQVQRTADDIFKKLMELDHAIVLFDEIDELVREREGGTDAFGRFLTTSMLPKLAELWESRKVMYFVATNHISFFDRAITRSQRFDAIIFVSPPSFDTKIGQLRKLLKDNFSRTVEFTFTKIDIEGALPNFKSEKNLEKKQLAPKNALAKFILMRYDELDELAEILHGMLGKETHIDQKLLSKALQQIGDGLWRTQREYYEYRRAPEYRRRDFSKQSIWIIEGLSDSQLADKVPKIAGLRVLDTPKATAAEIQFDGYATDNLGNGTIQLRKI